MQRFRILHLLASCIYLIYGLMIGAMPLIVGASLFSVIHCYRLYKIFEENNDTVRKEKLL